jgi:aspartate/methionine/tyrosine aminotransferase
MSAASAGLRQSVFAALLPRIRAEGDRLIPLYIGDTYLSPPERALRTAPEVDDLAVYGPPPGMPELAEALARHRRERGMTVATGGERLHVGCGCTHALFTSVRSILDPGDEVLVASPYWPLIIGVLATAGATPIQVPLTGRLYAEPGLDPAAIFEEARTPATRAVYLITPNNPDGQVLSRAQLESIAAFAQRHDLWVIADEVYADFIYEGEHQSIAELPGMFERTITSYSLSKSHALAGARIGYVIAPERVIEATRRFSNHTLYNVPMAMQRVALAAVEDGKSWGDEALALYREARDATSTALDAIGLDHHRPRGGSFFFLDLSARLQRRPLSSLLELAIDEGVLLAPGDAFGASYHRWARLCFTAAPLPQVIEGVHRFGRALEKLS